MAISGSILNVNKGLMYRWDHQPEMNFGPTQPFEFSFDFWISSAHKVGIFFNKGPDGGTGENVAEFSDVGIHWEFYRSPDGEPIGKIDTSNAFDYDKWNNVKFGRDAGYFWYTNLNGVVTTGISSADTCDVDGALTFCGFQQGDYQYAFTQFYGYIKNLHWASVEFGTAILPLTLQNLQQVTKLYTTYDLRD